MGRNNKNLTGVFSNIIMDGEPSHYRFIKEQKTLKKPKPELAQLNHQYKDILMKYQPIIEKLGVLEVLIMQNRILENFTEKDIKIYKLRNYIYARIPFYNITTKSKDIRVLVGKTSEWGANVKKLLGNEKFMGIVKEELTSLMKTQISITKTNYLK